MSSLLRNLRALDQLTAKMFSPLYIEIKTNEITLKNKFQTEVSSRFKSDYTVKSISPRRYITSYATQCWECGKDYDYKISNLFCGHCNALQRPQPKANLFNVIGLNQRFDINESELIRNYKNLQKHLHPDKYGRRSEEERLISEEYSSLVNKAYSTLLRPLTRGIYLIQLQGLEIPEKTELESVFLMEIMEKNEEVENATTKEEILQLNIENKRVIGLLCKQLSAAFIANDLNEVMRILTRLKYYDSLENEIKKVIGKMGIVE